MLIVRARPLGCPGAMGGRPASSSWSYRRPPVYKKPDAYLAFELNRLTW